MGAENYNTNPDANTSQLGMATGQGALQVSNVDNAVRKLMADIATFYQAWAPLIAQIAGKQGASTILNALVGAGAAAARVPYYTGSDQAALTPISPFGAGLLGIVDATAACNQLGAVRVAAISLTNPGYIKLQVSPTPQYLQFAWGSATFSAGSATTNYAAAFPNASFAICSAAAVVANANNPGVTACTTTGFTTYSALPGSIGGFYLAAGF